jgi:guanyl-specific ribonuclease Sa
MRAVGIIRWLLVVVALAAPAAAQRTSQPQTLPGFAAAIGLRDVAGFVETVDSLRTAHRLPPRYVTKEAAKARGWQGGGLCAVWPGHVIGGDTFHNFGAKLPAAPGRVYREADLDGDCRSRGAKRLIFSNDGLIFVTVDHYNTFTPVP